MTVHGTLLGQLNAQIRVESTATPPGSLIVGSNTSIDSDPVAFQDQGGGYFAFENSSYGMSGYSIYAWLNDRWVDND
jgi:hypothetical protein